MPLRLLRVYAAALPRLQAEETLAEMQTISLGSGLLEKRDAQSALRRLRMQAGIEPREKQSREEKLRLLAQAGVRIERVPG